MSCDLLPSVLRYLQASHPQSLLVLGQNADAYARACQSSRPDCRVHAAPTRVEVIPAVRYDLVVVAGLIEHLDKAAAVALIAQLRDFQALKLLVAAPLGVTWPDHASHWEERDFLALGMQVFERLDCAGRGLALFRFDIHDYKQVPDWFNSKYWAHPERWEP